MPFEYSLSPSGYAKTKEGEMEQEWFSVAQAAEKAGMALSTLRHRIHKGRVSTASYRNIPAAAVQWTNGRLVKQYVHQSEIERIAPTLPHLRAREVANRPVMDLVYLACAIDCEGSIGLHRQRSRHREHWCYSYSVQLSICNTDYRLTEWLTNTFGGPVRFRPMRAVNPRWKDRWDWVLCSYKACQILRAVRPYLKLKGEQADLIIEFYDRAYDRTTGGTGRNRLSDEESQWRAEAAERMHLLNKTGPHERDE
jgi:hypothetical protein